jgi:uncharacterized protein DUF5908
MAIIIKELVIKLNVTSKAENKVSKGEITPLAKAKIVNECVEKVLKKLELKIER